MVNRIVVGAHYGLRDWILQRATAVIMMIYTVALAVFLLTVPSSYDGWKAFFGHVWVQVLTQTTILAVLMHVWVGIRDVWMDYIKPVGLRLGLHVFTLVWLVSCFIYSVKVVWGL
ncbi:succinate dehydrogenase, hydrophobic membrane anchor protein [Paludibacterium denitrificans]|uniref:Succinate dehydrogenase hydrophobic membrane anchor subunit n=1 Tax=Paludibacterium denitrificans TaxID=2675226 RepID=A0A844G8N0_9NEIS|nr:succinate dehydrogenase, hydrophobic membrane anchor protein [Paludibacterium denitrificans]MTD32746.1 succinate dehydrogenase, hydrophobic membrane anchor protein [Paludibacterium denitrificans]HJV07073.1 succinate dehydrogenase, hydrophobic membrane anchor protein [Chromobacteriaceae bacterium]